MKMHLEAHGRSYPARWRALENAHKKTVSENGDSFLICSQPYLLQQMDNIKGMLCSVADGLGGEGNDDLASQTAVLTMEELVTGVRGFSGGKISTPSDWLQEAYKNVNSNICLEREVLGLYGMYTTLTTALFVPSDDNEFMTLYMANIGDSRIFMLRDNTLCLLSRDDGDSGMVSRVMGDPSLFALEYLSASTTVSRVEDNREKFIQALCSFISEACCSLNLKEMQVYMLASIFLGLFEGAYSEVIAMNANSLFTKCMESFDNEERKIFMKAISKIYIDLSYELAPISLQPNDIIFLCSDGITNAFDEQFIKETLSKLHNIGAKEDFSKTSAFEDVLNTFMTHEGQIDDDRTCVVIHVSDL